MRLVKVKTPGGRSDPVVQIAFKVGISQVITYQQQVRRPHQYSIQDVVEVETATPTAKTFIDTLMCAPFFDPTEYSISVRQPRSIIGREKLAKLTRPLVEPTIDILAELWQFSHVTVGFVGRVFSAGLLLAYGMIENALLIMIAGLLFMPLLPLMLAVGFGLWTKQWRLAGQGVLALATGTVLAIAAGAVVAFMTGPPLQYSMFSLPLSSFLISLVVGMAAGLATADNAGRREMVGLAATAQVTILPVWLGIALVFDFPTLDRELLFERGMIFLMNVSTIIAASSGTYALLGASAETLRCLKADTASKPAQPEVESLIERKRHSH